MLAETNACSQIPNRQVWDRKYVEIEQVQDQNTRLGRLDSLGSLAADMLIHR